MALIALLLIALGYLIAGIPGVILALVCLVLLAIAPRSL